MHTKAKPFTRPALLLLAGLATLLAGCTDDSAWRSGPGVVTTMPGIPSGASVVLTSLPDCEADLARLEDLRRRAFDEDRYREYDASLDRTSAADATKATPAPGAARENMGAAASAAGDSPQTTMPTDPAAGDDIVGTNLQEAGVDEADVVKTDGRLLVTLGRGALQVIRMDDDPQVDGRVTLPTTGAAPELYLLGTKVIVVDGGAYRDDGTPQVTLSQVDVSDPTAPRILKALAVSGELVSSRAVEGTVHLVLSSYTDAVLPLAYERGGSPTRLGGCEDVLVETVADAAGGRREQMVELAAPGSETVTVVSFTSLQDELRPTVIEGSGGVVYASTDSLYVASPQWNRGSDATAIHRFDLTGGSARYVASGMVTGQLLNQFSLSEYDSVLRVVTTGQDAAVFEDLPAVSDDVAPLAEPGSVVGEPASPMTSVPDVTSPLRRSNGPSTRLTTLRTADMKVLGQVGDLAPGESVRSSRFIGPMAYVVTFRQTDPLFALDVSDPAAPKVLGELKIPGFSEYLHPIGDDLLLGVGRDVDPQSGRDRGLKLSLFDVSDPRDPRELDTWVRANAYSPVSDSHHAFTWDAKRRRAILPVAAGCTNYGVPAPSDVPVPANPDEPVASPPLDATIGVAADGFSMTECGAAVIFEVDAGHITELTSVSHPIPPGSGAPVTEERVMPDRSLIVGDTLWTRSPIGVGHSPVTEPANVTLVAFR